MEPPSSEFVPGVRSATPAVACSPWRWATASPGYGLAMLLESGRRTAGRLVESGAVFASGELDAALAGPARPGSRSDLPGRTLNQGASRGIGGIEET